MDTSSDSGAPAMPGSVVATKRTPDSAGSAITRLNERAALAPPGRSRTDRSAASGPKVTSSQASLMATSAVDSYHPDTTARRSPRDSANPDEPMTHPATTQMQIGVMMRKWRVRD